MRCDQCGARIRGRAYTSVTGRRLCQRCGTRLQGRTAGMIGGGRGTGGWFARVRKTMRKG